jgi:predicted HAD superfamily Cof-like phosphohydrolase
MQKSQKAVKEFMTTFGQATPDKPTIPPEDVLKMRCSTLVEEAAEFAMAAGYILDVHASPSMKVPIIELRRVPDAVPDLLGMVDALVDSQYFVDGSGVALGVDLEPFFDVVHKTNMNKVWLKDELSEMKPDWTAQAVKLNNDNFEGTLGTRPRCFDVVFIVRREDGKVMKPPRFKPADLSQVLKAQMQPNCLQVSECGPQALIPADDPNAEPPHGRLRS